MFLLFLLPTPALCWFLFSMAALKERGSSGCVSQTKCLSNSVAIFIEQKNPVCYCFPTIAQGSKKICTHTDHKKLYLNLKASLYYVPYYKVVINPNEFYLLTWLMTAWPEPQSLPHSLQPYGVSVDNCVSFCVRPCLCAPDMCMCSMCAAAVTACHSVYLPIDKHGWHGAHGSFSADVCLSALCQRIK